MLSVMGGVKYRLSIIDKIISHRIGSLSDNKKFREASHAITELGTTPGWLFLAMGVGSINPGLGGGLFILLCVSEFVNHFIKVAIRRPRPKYIIQNGRVEPGWSFPSSHSQNSAALLLVLMHYSPVFLSIIWVVFILFMGFSRIVLRKHYFSDVIAGFSVGLILYLVFMCIYAKVLY